MLASDGAKYRRLSDADVETQTCERPWWWKPLQVLGLITLWWVSAVLIILTIKDTVSSSRGFFPYPFALSALTQPVCAFWALLLSLALQRNNENVPALEINEGLQLLTIGAFQGIEIGLQNKALEYLNVATRTMVGSTNVFFVMTTASMWGLESLGFLRCMSAFLLIVGGSFQGMDAQDSGQSSHALGVGMQVMSMLVSAQRWAMVQFVLQRSAPHSALGKMLKMQLLAWTLPVTGLMCFLLAVLFESSAFEPANILQIELLRSVLTVSIALVGMLYAEVYLVTITSAVAVNVLSAVHQIPIVMVGVVVQHNEVKSGSVMGFGLCIMGALVYAVARLVERQPGRVAVDPSAPEISA